MKLNNVAMPPVASLTVTPFDKVIESYYTADGKEHVEYLFRGKRKVNVRWEQLNQSKMNIILGQLKEVVSVEVYDRNGQTVTFNAKVSGQSNSPYKLFGPIVKYIFFELELTEL